MERQVSISDIIVVVKILVLDETKKIGINSEIKNYLVELHD